MDTTCGYRLHWPSTGVAKEKQGALSGCLDGVYLVTLHADCGSVITFRVSRRPREMYCGHARLCVCLRLHAHTIASTRM